MIAKRKGHTLANYCHDRTEMPERQPGERRAPDALIVPGCPRFPTKPENTPDELVEAIERAETVRQWHALAGPGEWVLRLDVLDFACLAAVKDAEGTVLSERRPPGGAGAGAGGAGQGGAGSSSSAAPLTPAFAAWADKQLEKNGRG